MKEKPITPATVKATYTPQKAATDKNFHFWAFIVIRPLSFWVSVPFLKLGFSATAVTIFGAVVLAIGLFILGGGFDDLGWLVAGAILVNLWYMLDFVDGNVARFNQRPSDLGAFLDWLTGHGYHVLLPAAVGLALSNMLEAPWALYLGFGCAILEASRPSISQRRGGKASDNAAVLERPLKQLLRSPKFILYTLISFKAPLLLICVILGVLQIWLIGYTLLAFAAWSGVVATAINQAKKADRQTNINKQDPSNAH